MQQQFTMDPILKQALLEAKGTAAITLQTLWSGYGRILRVPLPRAKVDSVILKQIILPDESDHPAGWNTERSHARKMHSYQVEMEWYQHWSQRCDEFCRVARCYDARADEHEQVIALEDLDGAGFTLRKSRLSKNETKLCLEWLAHFHATFMDETPAGLWPSGTYWHLATRPDELAALQDPHLKQAAARIDERLNHCRFQTIIHGDAKVENFCFHSDGKHVAAVDFQYVGGGCGMKDVAYLFDSCMSGSDCEVWGDELLEHYFATLQQALKRYHKTVEWVALEREWRELYPSAWADFYRFLLGWAPAQYGVSSYARRLIAEAIRDLDTNR